jgi:hypothetical protein
LGLRVLHCHQLNLGRWLSNLHLNANVSIVGETI